MSVPTRLFKCCVLGCINEHRRLHRTPPSEQRSLSFIVLGNVLEKKSVKSPIRVGINTNSLCADVSSRQSKYLVCFPNCPSERASRHSVKLMMLKLPLSLSVFTGAVFMNDRE